MFTIFLQKLRTKFVIKRNQRKRQREDEHEKDDVNKSSPVKRQKGDDPSVKSEPTDMDTNPTHVDDEKAVSENDNSNNDKEDVVKMEDESDEEEDPEEDPEEYEEMENGSPKHDASADKNDEQEVNADIKPENITNDKVTDETSKGDIKVKDEVQESKADAQLKEEKDDTKKETPPVKEVVVDRELLQVFSCTL